jgi:hypothetical protein
MKKSKFQNLPNGQAGPNSKSQRTSIDAEIELKVQPYLKPEFYWF